MTYQPVFPAGGNLGWTFLKQTRAPQQAAFDNSTIVKRETEYFREKIGQIGTAEDLISDRRILSVALGAFGLDDDINNRFFIKKVLEEGTTNDDAFANRLSDKRYFAISEAFSFDLTPPNTVLSDFGDRIVEQYQIRQFEVAVGNQDENLRLAMGAERELSDLAQLNLSEDAAWFTIMGNPPMRRVFESALGLPSEVAAVDIDRQLEMFREKSLKTFGVTNPIDFTDTELQDKLVRRFLIQEQFENSGSSARGSVALSLLQSQAPLF